MTVSHREPDILEYRFAAVEEDGMQSGWLLTFFERTTFIGVVWESEEARARARAREAS